MCKKILQGGSAGQQCFQAARLGLPSPTPQAPTRVTYFCEPRCAVPLAVCLQVAAGIRSLVYQAEQLNTLWRAGEKERICRG